MFKRPTDSKRRSGGSLRALLTASAILIASAFQPALAQSPASGESERLSKEQLAGIEAVLEPYVSSGTVSGLVTLVAHKGKVVHLGAMGQRDIDAGAPMTPDTIMRIYSMTKPITTVAVMQLIERGKVKLDDPLEKFIPEFSDPKVYVSETEDGTVTTVPANRSITIKDLLTHTSGLTYGIIGKTAVHKQYQAVNYMQLGMPLEEFARKIAKIPLIAQPGETFNYSVSIEILGRVIEIASGQALNEYFKDNISTPLAMKDTDFLVPSDKIDRFSDLYTTNKEGKLVLYDDNETGELSGKLPQLLMGGGGLVSTANDYYRFSQMILNKGELDGVRVLKPETVEMMSKSHLPATAPHINLGPGFVLPGVGFGYGFAVSENPTSFLLKATGPGDLWWGGFSTTLFWIDTKEDIVGILMAQQVPPAEAQGLREELRMKFRQPIYDALNQFKK